MQVWPSLDVSSFRVCVLIPHCTALNGRFLLLASVSTVSAYVALNPVLIKGITKLGSLLEESPMKSATRDLRHSLISLFIHFVFNTYIITTYYVPGTLGSTVVDKTYMVSLFVELIG